MILSRRSYKLKKLLVEYGFELTRTDDIFRSRRRPGEPNVLLSDERTRLDPNLAWYGAALLFVSGGSIALVASSLAGIPGVLVPEQVQNWNVRAVGAAALLLAVIWLWCARRNVPAMPWLHALLISGFVLITLGLASTTTAAPSLLPYYTMIVMFAAFFLPLRQGLPYVAASLVAITYFGLANREVPYAYLEMFLAIILFGTVWAFLTFARRKLQSGLLRNLELAGEDPLTGIGNARRFQDSLEREMLRADRFGSRLCLLMLDLDDFKKVNDDYSHTLGDGVLVSCAQALAGAVRPDEVVARRGGDEFAVLAIERSPNDCAQLIADIKTLIRDRRKRLCPDVTPDASIGAATFIRGDRPTDLLQRADDALHAAKLEKQATAPS